MVLFQKELKSKQLTNYVDFLKRLKDLGNEFLIKGDMWIPSTKEIAGIHIGRDPMLYEYYTSPTSVYTKYTCTHLNETLSNMVTTGRKHHILFEITDTELSLYINDTQWVIASKYKDATTDFCPDYDYFDSVLFAYKNWYTLQDETLQALVDGHPVTLNGIISETNETTCVRLTKKIMKLRGNQCRKVDHTGEYTLSNKTDGSYDHTVCKLIIHMNYQKIECINIYHIRKYRKKDN